MEQLIVENKQPVIGKIIELIIRLSQIDVIRILLRAPFAKDSEMGYTNQGLDNNLYWSGMAWYPCLYLVLFESSTRNFVFRLGWIYVLYLPANHNCTFPCRELEPYWNIPCNLTNIIRVTLIVWYDHMIHKVWIMSYYMAWKWKTHTYHSDIWSKEKWSDKVPLVLFHPCVEQKLNHSIDLLLLLFTHPKPSFILTHIQFSLSVFWWFPRICTQTWGKQGLSVIIKLWFPLPQCFMVFKNFDFMRIRSRYEQRLWK